VVRTWLRRNRVGSCLRIHLEHIHGRGMADLNMPRRMYGNRVCTEEVEEDVEKGGLALENIYAQSLNLTVCNRLAGKHATFIEPRISLPSFLN